MKKLLALTLAGALFFALSACGVSSAPAPTSSSSTQSVSSEAASPIEPQDLVMGTGSTGGTYF